MDKPSREKHIVSFSGGKDSTAMLLRMVELKMPFDEVVYFDAEDWEFPEMSKHIDQVESYIKQPITRLKNPRNFNYWMFEHQAKKGKWMHKVGRGFPSPFIRWCTREKVSTIKKHIPKDTINYIGYAYDESHRVKKAMTIGRYPLIEWEWTEKDCLEYCYSKGFKWSGLYDIFSRVSCWCCPLQSLTSLRKLYKHFPMLWTRLSEMQERSWNSFRMDGKTVSQLETRFKNEEQQGIFWKVSH